MQPTTPTAPLACVYCGSIRDLAVYPRLEVPTGEVREEENWKGDLEPYNVMGSVYNAPACGRCMGH